MPSPHALTINVSQRQHQLLQQITRCKTNSYRLVQRAQLVLFAATGMKNTTIGEQLELSRTSVRQWRQRWCEAVEQLFAVEAEGISDLELKQKFVAVLNDEQRPGSPAKFSLEQIVQIVAVACEQPASSRRPISHWTPRELAAEVVKRGIVQEISPRSVGRFLKRGDIATTSKPLLAECSTHRPTRVQAASQSGVSVVH